MGSGCSDLGETLRALNVSRIAMRGERWDEEPSRPGTHEHWTPNVGCREGGRERKSKMIPVWMVAGTFDQERRQGRSMF